MKYCSKCGQIADDDARYCKKCGVSFFGKSGEYDESKRYNNDKCNSGCNNSGYDNYNSYDGCNDNKSGGNSNNNSNNNNSNGDNGYSFNVNLSKESANLLLLVLGFFVPIVGLVLYIVYKDSEPEKAKAAGKGALISVCVSVGLSILGTVFAILFNVVLFLPLTCLFFI